jgi:hypothetical protein
VVKEAGLSGLFSDSTSFKLLMMAGFIDDFNFHGEAFRRTLTVRPEFIGGPVMPLVQHSHQRRADILLQKAAELREDIDLDDSWLAERMLSDTLSDLTADTELE